MPTELELILRLLLAAALAGALGVERELTDQPAGFRTHILVGVGAALFMEISAYGFQSVVAGSPDGSGANVDVSRVAAQIVTGIGFLGGGAILKYGASVRGLTTAANLWIAAAIGSAIGIGELGLGAVTTGIVLAALVGLRPLRRLVRRYSIGKEEFIIEADVALESGAVTDELHRRGVAVREISITEEGGIRHLRLLLRIPAGVKPAALVSDLASIPHVRTVDWSN